MGGGAGRGRGSRSEQSGNASRKRALREVYLGEPGWDCGFVLDLRPAESGGCFHLDVPFEPVETGYRTAPARWVTCRLKVTAGPIREQGDVYLLFGESLPASLSQTSEMERRSRSLIYVFAGRVPGESQIHTEKRLHVKKTPLREGSASSPEFFLQLL